MSLKLVFVLIALSGVFGILLGYAFRWLVALGRSGSLELEIKQRLLEAKEKANNILYKAEEEAEKLEHEKLKDVRLREDEVREKEQRLIKREELLDERQIDIDRENDRLKREEATLERREEELKNLIEQKEKELETIADISKEDARKELIESMEKDYEESLMLRAQRLETANREQLEEKAKTIITNAIHRFGNAVHADVMSFQFPLPNDETKGKIIGKEGRNIRAFERATGVDVIIDDTPGYITISSFDPIRRHTARLTLERLLSDGRIQPAKIEEAVEKARQEIEETIKRKGEEAAYEAKVHDLPPELIKLLGRLHFRTSYGQNILQHSIEMAHIAAMLAEEVGADVKTARTGALLHDIGKAVDHAVQGTHVEIGRRILQKFNVSEEVIKAMQAHHEEYPYETPESIIVQVADAISAGRPGARRDTVENYLKRLEDLERIAKEFPGVEKCYAIEAGREVRVFVNPGKVKDVEMHKLARDIASRVQHDLRYPGEIKVNIIRENRVVEFAR
ncbi:MAG: ribonuclease Y [Patescibacteria group bacterium UBA2103]